MQNIHHAIQYNETSSAHSTYTAHICSDWSEKYKCDAGGVRDLRFEVSNLP